MEGGGPARREPHQEQQHATMNGTMQQEGGGGGGVITRRTPTPTCHHPLAAEMGLPLPGGLGSLAAKEAESSADAAAAAAAPARAEEGPHTDDVCAACRFGITGDEPAVRALQGLYHRECFRCHDCGAALLPPGAPGPADAVARALRRVRLGSLDEADSEGETVEEEGEEDGNHLTFLQLGGLPLCREHFRARLLMLLQQQQEEDEATVPASPPTSAFATPDPPAPHQQQQHEPPPPASPAGSQQDGSSYATTTGATAATVASAPSSLQVRFAPPVETQKARLPPIFHSADGLSRLEVPPPDVGDGDADAIGRGGSEPSPTSLARLRRSKSATTLRSGGQGTHQRRGSRAHPLLAVAARETEAERDARLLRRRASQQELLFGGVGALSPPLPRGGVEGGEGQLSSPQRQQHQQPPPPLRPLTTASALAYGVRVMGGVLEVEEETELEKGAFSERRQRELVYSCGAGEKPVSFFWEEAAPAVFARIRALFGVAPGAYAAALATLEEDRRESGNTGKSGSRFLRPPRAESGAPVIVKSVSDEEAAFLLSILDDYLQVVLHRHTLLPRFLGLYRIKEPGKPPTRLLAQRNVFALPTPHLRLKERYDLKGSLIRRLAVPPPASENGGGGNSSGGGAPPAGSAAARANGSSSGNGRARVPVQKDLAFCLNHDGTDDAGNGVKAAPGAACRVVRLGAERKKELLSFLAADVEWLRRRNVVDYSLLLGCASLQEFNTNPWARRGGDGGASSLAALLPGAPDEESRHRLYSLWLPEHEATTTTMPPGGASGTASPPISIFSTQDAFLMGLVDILQTFTLKRRLETVVKSGLASLEGKDPGGLSIVDPATYAQRLVSWVDNHTV